MKSLVISFFLSFFLFQNINAQALDTIPFSLQEYFTTQKKNVFKTNITSPLLGNFSFSLEHAFRPRRTLEARFSFINSNQVSTESIDGFYLGLGHKFFTSPLHSARKGWTVPILQGFYIQPELLVGFTNKNIFSTTIFASGVRRYSPIEKQKINYQVLLSNFGLQVLLYKLLIVDVFAGVGLGRDNLDSNGRFFFPQNEAIYHQGILKMNKGISLAGKVGVRLGILF